MRQKALGRKLLFVVSLLSGTASQAASLAADEINLQAKLRQVAPKQQVQRTSAEDDAVSSRSAKSDTAPTPARRPLRISAAELNESQNTPAEPVLPQAADDGPVEVIEQRYPNGAIMLEREVTLDAEGNYMNHGSWRMWDQEGNLIVEGRCRDNQLHGQWRRVYHGTESKLFAETPYDQFEAPFVSEATFEDGMLHGAWTIKDAQDRKASVIEFQDGDRHGFARWWYPSGKKMQEIPFKNGFVDGEVRMWSPEGDVTAEESYQSGRQLSTKVEFYSPGVKKIETSYLQPQMILQSADDWWKAKLATFTTQGSMEKHGPQTRWFQNGQKQMDAEYRNGQLDGHCTWWYSNGQRAAEGSFSNGKPTNNWTWWHSNGQKAASGQYTDGAITGTWAWWMEDGRLKSRVATETVAPATPENEGVREASIRAADLPEVHVR